jgi:hypothetical protein
MPDYSPGETLGPLRGVIAIVAGTLLVFAIALGLSKVLAEKKKAKEPKSSH